MNHDTQTTFPCATCGRQLPAGALLCPQCGTLVNPTPPLTPPLTPPPAATPLSSPPANSPPPNPLTGPADAPDASVSSRISANTLANPPAAAAVPGPIDAPRNNPVNVSGPGSPPGASAPVPDPPARLRCSKCGRELQPSWEACPSCGWLLPDGETAPQGASRRPVSTPAEPKAANPPPPVPRPQRSLAGWLTGLGILALLLGCGLVVALAFLFNTTQNLLLVEGELDHVSQTATAAHSGMALQQESQLATLAAAENQLAEQQLALENQALTFSAASTAQAQEYEDALRLQAEQCQATVSAVLLDSSQVVYGPADGELTHKIDTFIETSWAEVNLLNPIITARFYNPYDPAEGPWDYGFMFRHTATNDQYRLIISSDGRWHLVLSQGEERPELASGAIDNIDLSPQGSNLISLWVKDGTANLYVNDEWVTALDVSAKPVTGDVAVCTGFYTGYEIEGKITRFEGFTVSEIP